MDLSEDVCTEKQKGEKTKGEIWRLNIPDIVKSIFKKSHSINVC